tara:strand:+ start:111 stop:344 length:234 start_codon:yes stop_codon:yes gene_type:complete
MQTDIPIERFREALLKFKVCGNIIVTQLYKLEEILEVPVNQDEYLILFEYNSYPNLEKLKKLLLKLGYNVSWRKKII